MPVLQRGRIVVSVELSAKSLPAAVPLLQVLREYDLPACLVLAEPGGDGRAALHHAAEGSEIAWLARNLQQRGDFSRELKRHSALAAQHGLYFSVLAAEGEKLLEFPDLLVKHRVGVLLNIPERASRTSLQPRWMRFGIWRAAPTLMLADCSTWPWSPWTWLWNARRQLREASRRADIAHLWIGQHSTHVAQTAIRCLRQVCESASALRRLGHLAPATLSDVVAELQGKRRTASGRSILRAA